jgi:hypothetical protein
MRKYPAGFGKGVTEKAREGPRRYPTSFGGGRLETYHRGRASARANSGGDARAAYPIVEVTDSSSVSPISQKSGFALKPLFYMSTFYYVLATRSPMPSSRVRWTPAVS